MDILVHALRWLLSPLLKVEPVSLYRKFRPDRKWYLQHRPLADYLSQKDMVDIRSVKLSEIIKISLWDTRPAKTFLASFLVISLALFFKTDFELGFWLLSLFALILIVFSGLETAPVFSKLLLEYLSEKKYLNQLILKLRQMPSYEQFVNEADKIEEIKTPVRMAITATITAFWVFFSSLVATLMMLLL